MKKTLFFFTLLMFVTLSLFAERASWFVSDREEYKLKTSEIFSDDALVARSNIYPIGTVLSVHSSKTGLDAIVIVSDRVHEALNSETLELSAAALEELGLFNRSGGDVTISVIKDGAEETKTDEDSGWFKYITEPYDNADDCYVAYSRLLRNGLNPVIDIKDGLLAIEIRHVREYQKDDIEKKIALSGIERAELKAEANPYLR